MAEKTRLYSRRWIKAVRFLAFWTVFLLLLAGVNRLMTKHHSTAMGPEVLQYGDEIQVAFAGSSHVLNGISPQQLWNEKGIQAQTIASHGETMVCTYWHLRNALDYMQPEIVFLDLYGINFEGKIYANGDPRSWLDALPLTRTKVETVLDLYGWDGISALWPFTYEHTRWNSLKQEDLKEVQPDLGRGEERNGGVVPQLDNRAAADGGPANTLGLEYLQKIVQLCREKNIRLVPLILPYALSSSSVENNLAAAMSLLQEEGLEVLDLRGTECINPITDYADYHHLNVSGMNKVTRLLGDWLAAQGMKTKNGQDQAIVNKWNQSYAGYRQQKRNEIQACREFEDLLIRLYDTDYSCALSIPPQVYLWTDDSYAHMRALLENLGIELTGRENETGLYVVVDSRDAKFSVEYGPDSIQTDWGLIQWQDRTTGTEASAPIFLLDDQAFTCFDETTDMSSAAGVLILENYSQNAVWYWNFALDASL